jgi:hypothetical protein
VVLFLFLLHFLGRGLPKKREILRRTPEEEEEEEDLKYW